MKSSVYFKSISVAILCLFSKVDVNARILSPNEAIARVPVASRIGSRAVSSCASFELIDSVARDNRPCMYLFGQADESVMVVSADDRAMPVLALLERADNADCSREDNYWLDYYAAQIASLDKCSKAVRDASEPSVERADITPLIETQWGQRAPYNDKIYHYYTQEKCLTGCVTTAVAQIMNYWHWPSGNAFGRYDGIYGKYPTDFSEISFDWDAMLNVYNGDETAEQRDAVANLMSAVAISLGTNFNSMSSSAKPDAVPYALVQQFDYDPHMMQYRKGNMSQEEWAAIMYNELAANRPILYFGNRPDFSEGHAFVCDGYKSFEGMDYFHFNMGWKGGSDGYYLLSAIGSNTDDMSTWSADQQMLVGIQPNVTETIDNDLLQINCPWNCKVSRDEDGLTLSNIWIDCQAEWCYYRLSANIGVRFVDETGVELESVYLSENIPAAEWNRYSVVKPTTLWSKLEVYYPDDFQFAYSTPGTYTVEFFYEIVEQDGSVIINAPLAMPDDFTLTYTVDDHFGTCSAESVLADNEMEACRYFTLDGIALSDIPTSPGIYVVASSKGARKVYIR